MSSTVRLLIASVLFTLSTGCTKYRAEEVAKSDPVAAPVAQQESSATAPAPVPEPSPVPSATPTPSAEETRAKLKGEDEALAQETEAQIQGLVDMETFVFDDRDQWFPQGYRWDVWYPQQRAQIREHLKVIEASTRRRLEILTDAALADTVDAGALRAKVARQHDRAVEMLGTLKAYEAKRKAE